MKRGKGKSKASRQPSWRDAARRILAGLVLVLVGVAGLREAALRLWYGGEPWAWMALLSALAVFVGVKVLAWRRLTKGERGERLVSERLRRDLPPEAYEVLDDLYLPLEEGGTTQIDHVVISRYGVFAVETKTYSGWISAPAQAPYWKQKVCRARASHLFSQTAYAPEFLFQNPIRQNYLHVSTLAERLGLPKKHFHGVVVFAGDAKFTTPRPPGVVSPREAAAYIMSFGDVVFDARKTAEIADAIKAWDASVTPRQRRDHVKNLERRHAAKREEKA